MSHLVSVATLSPLSVRPWRVQGILQLVTGQNPPVAHDFFAFVSVAIKKEKRRGISRPRHKGLAQQTIAVLNPLPFTFSPKAFKHDAEDKTTGILLLAFTDEITIQGLQKGHRCDDSGDIDKNKGLGDGLVPSYGQQVTVQLLATAW